MGLDRLTVLLLLVLLAAACSSGGGRPAHLLDGRPAPEFRPVRDSVISATRVLERIDAQDCLVGIDRESVAASAIAVERVGVDGRSITFTSRDGAGV
jgi:hypothetical protein